LSCLSVPLKYCGNYDGDEPLQTESTVNVFVLPGHEIFLSGKLIQMYRLIIMVHVGINFSEFLGMKTLSKLGCHIWVSLQL